MAVGFALSGFANSLPASRRQMVGVFRVTSILVFCGLVILAFFAPGVVLPP